MHPFPWLQEAAAIYNNRKQGHVPCQAEYVHSLMQKFVGGQYFPCTSKEQSIFLPSAAQQLTPRMWH